jgi:hypothetical protein
MIVGDVPEAVSANATYGLGWFVDSYNGSRRVSHGGYLHDVNSEVTLFPEEGIGIVSFTNFGFVRFARFINEHVFDALLGLESVQSLEDKLALNERKRRGVIKWPANTDVITSTREEHSPADCIGAYVHSAYGNVQVQLDGGNLVLNLNGLMPLTLEHCHGDSWCARPSDWEFLTHHESHPFDCNNRLRFETNAAGAVDALAIRMEPAVPVIRFQKAA